MPRSRHPKGGEEGPLPGQASAESTESCACALNAAGPSNRSSDSSNRRNGEYPPGLLAKAEMRLGLEKGDCEVLRAAGFSNSGRESIADVGSVESEA
ncbi:Hypothetical predicted protein [Marmota monax]|uniref:Uncharacterized protein n=1 Tax=Marmota monax TaxID=9995 RepID=A0A5E4AY67_MARMO|nr:hypothetical protein GHT09_004934 [Marmota monax]VTJ62433.1 Hypothetical predicted protein [Marmota monax]